MEPQIVFVTAIVGMAALIGWLWWKLVRLIVSWSRAQTPAVAPDPANAR